VLSLIPAAYAVAEEGSGAVAEVAVSESARAFKVVTRVEEYGAVVPAVIIDMGETITAGGFDAESFAVTMNRLTNATTVNPTPADRTVTKAYVNDKAEIDPAGAGAASGRYIVLELQYGYNDVNYSYVMQYLGGSNIVRPLEMYTVRQTAAITNGEAVIPADTLYENAGRINLLVDDFSRETTADGLNYRLFTPEKEAGKTYPLIVWLHGGGEGHSPTSLGVGNEEQLFGNEGATAWAEPARQAQNPAYVAAPQAAPRWSRASTPQIRAMIGEILAANPDVDPARIYVTGCSMGGMMTMLMITAYPDLFAAAMPICPASPSPALTTEEYANLADLPLWLFHAQNDTTVRIGQSSDLIWATLQELGKEPSESFKYRIFPTVEYNQHWSWVPVANDSYNGETIGVVDWLFAQAKKSAAYPFKVVTRVEEYGAVVPAVIIDMGETVTAGGFDAESFAVTLHRLDINFMTGGVSVNPEPVSRTVTKAYVNNAEQIDPAGVGTPSGRYIVLEMPYSSSDNADYSAVMQYAMNFANFVASHNVVRPLEMYAVHQTAAITNGEAVIPANTLYENAGRINLIVDDFSRETTADGLNYRLFTPEKEAGKTYPLIVWLHGAGEGHSPTDFGVGNEEQLLGNEGATAWAEPARQAQNPAYVAAPQAVTVWERTDAAKIKTMIDDILAANPDVDLARIYVMGCSMGGMMTMSMITAYPNLFAAAIPICAATMVANPAFTTEDYAKLVDLPMWLFHAQDDGTVVIGQSSDLIWATMQELGKEPGESFKYRIFPTVAPYMEHWSWVPVANDSYNGETIGVVDWLFAQVKTGDFTVTADKAAKTVTVTGRNYVSGRKLPLFAEYRTPSADADGEYETTVTADEDGRFSVTLPAALTTDKPWLGGHKYVVTVDDVVHTAPIYTTELRAHSSARVSLRIKGRAPLNLRTDADPTFYEVTVSNPAIASVTQVNGVWTVTGLRAGTVLVMVRATDGSDLTHAVTVSVA
jgi:predicted peptidase